MKRELHRRIDSREYLEASEHRPYFSSLWPNHFRQAGVGPPFAQFSLEALNVTASLAKRYGHSLSSEELIFHRNKSRKMLEKCATVVRGCALAPGGPRARGPARREAGAGSAPSVTNRGRRNEGGELQ